jgi:hypothetical protein
VGVSENIMLILMSISFFETRNGALPFLKCPFIYFYVSSDDTYWVSHEKFKIKNPMSFYTW